MIENSEYISMIKRILRAGAVRVGQSDEHDLRSFANLRGFLDEQIKNAILTQISEGKSWNDIGFSLGVSRQAAFKKYGVK